MNVDLRLGDCLDVLPTLSSDVAIVTDPPYGIRYDPSSGGDNSAVRNLFAPVLGDDQDFNPSPLLRFNWVILWGGNHYADKLPNRPSWFVWDKREGVNSNDMADCEMAWTNLGGPARLFRHMWMGMIRSSERGEARVHPTQKPVALMRWCIEQARLPAGTLICDPYMGSGSTGKAAMQVGYPFIGIERDPAYFAIARRRIEQAQAQLTLPLFDR